MTWPDVPTLHRAQERSAEQNLCCSFGSGSIGFLVEAYDSSGPLCFARAAAAWDYFWMRFGPVS